MTERLFPRVQHPHPGHQIDLVLGHGETEQRITLSTEAALTLGSDLVKAAAQNLGTRVTVNEG